MVLTTTVPSTVLTASSAAASTTCNYLLSGHPITIPAHGIYPLLLPRLHVRLHRIVIRCQHVQINITQGKFIHLVLLHYFSPKECGPKRFENRFPQISATFPLCPSLYRVKLGVPL